MGSGQTWSCHAMTCRARGVKSCMWHVSACVPCCPACYLRIHVMYPKLLRSLFRYPSVPIRLHPCRACLCKRPGDRVTCTVRPPRPLPAAVSLAFVLPPTRAEHIQPHPTAAPPTSPAPGVGAHHNDARRSVNPPFPHSSPQSSLTMAVRMSCSCTE